MEKFLKYHILASQFFCDWISFLKKRFQFLSNNYQLASFTFVFFTLAVSFICQAKSCIRKGKERF